MTIAAGSGSAAPYADPLMEADLEELETLATPETDASQASLAAFASDILRAIGELDLERAQLVARRDAEIARIVMRYSGQIDRVERRRHVLEGALAAVADRYDFGKKKTAVVGFGQFGRRAVPEKLAVKDAGELLAWAEKAAPELVRVTTKRDVPHNQVTAYFRQTGEVPEGCEYVAAHEVLVVKPELGLVEMGVRDA